MTLPTRTIGPFTVSSIGLGCMNLSHAYGTPPREAEGVALLNRALDLGVTFLDTAALYGGGANERLVAKVMHRRSAFTLASKCVLDMRDGQRILDGSPDAIATTLQGSGLPVAPPTRQDCSSTPTRRRPRTSRPARTS